MEKNSVDYFQMVRSLHPGEMQAIQQVINEIWACVKKGKSMWIIGNGGSASTSNHFAVDLAFVRLGTLNMNVRVHSLCANSSLITAIGNDIGFDYIFSHQISRYAEPGDICFAISASGNSQNLIEAFNICKLNGVKTISLLGFDGGLLANLSDLYVLIESAPGLYGPVEDIHLSICHFIAEELKKHLSGEPK